jgi:hypothetical protein
MHAAVFNGPHGIEIAELPDPVIQSPTDAIVASRSDVSAAPISGTSAGTPLTTTVPSATNSSASWRMSGRRYVA